MNNTSRLIAFALALCPAEFREEFGEQIQADAESHGNAGAIAFDIAMKGLGLYLESFVRDVAFAVRILRKTPVFTGAAILTLAIAISVNATVFGAINAVLLKPLPFVQSDRLAFICNGNRENGDFRCTDPALLTPIRPLLAIDHAIGDIAVFQYVFVSINGFGASRSVLSAPTTTNFFDVLQIKPELGRFFTPADGRPGVDAIVISDRIWRTLYNADPHILGRAITFTGIPHTFNIIGVAPPQLVMPIPGDRTLAPQAADIFIGAGPLAYPQSVILTSPSDANYNPKVFMRLRDGVSFASAQAELDRLTRYGTARSFLLPGSSVAAIEKPDINVVPFVHWYSTIDNIRLSLTIALMAAIAVLFIACANIANLLLARGTSRQGELAVRSALGATRARIIRQLVAEISVLAIMSGILGIALAYAELQVLRAIGPGFLPRMQDVTVDGKVLLFTCAIVVFVTILAGVAPALLTSPKNLALTLKSAGRGRDDAAGKAFRSSLVVLEVALAFAVIISSVLLVRSFFAIIHTDMGFDPRNVYVAKTTVLPLRYQVSPNARAELTQAVLNQINAIPGVEAVAAGSSIPFMDNALGQTTPSILLSGTAQTPTLVPCNTVTPGYFDALRIPVVRGRAFTNSDRATSASVVVVTEAFAKSLHLANPIGKFVTLLIPNEETLGTTSGRASARIVGMVGDTTTSKEDASSAYVAYAQYPNPPGISEFMLRIRSDDPHINNEVTAAITSVDPTVGIQQFVSLNDEFSKRAAPQRTSALLLSALALVALVLALVGIYAVLSYAVDRRTHEFGIRKAVGAQTRDILRLVLRGAIIYAVAGIALGIIFASFLTKALTGLLAQTSPFDPLTFICAIVILIVSTLAAATIPGIRAMRIDPAVALRYE